MRINGLLLLVSFTLCLANMQSNAVNSNGKKERMEVNVITNNVVSAPVYFSLNPSFRKPKLMRYVANRKHVPGSDVLLPCLATGYGPITYRWKFNGKPLISRYRIKFGFTHDVLKIKRIRDQDVGTYTCTVENPYGKLTFDFHVKTSEKQTKPVFYDLSLMQRKRLAIRPTTQAIRFQCEADSRTPVHYLWLKNNKIIKHIKPIKNKHNDGVLDLTHLKVKDGGEYTCIAFNSYGNTSFTYTLAILWRLSGGPPKVIPFTRPQTRYVNVGDNVTFDCLEIMSATLPDVKWIHLINKKNKHKLPHLPAMLTFKDDQSFSSKFILPTQYSMFDLNLTNHRANNKFIYDNAVPSGIRLNLRNVSSDDTGAYTCFISNNEGSDYYVYYLVVKEI